MLEALLPLEAVVLRVHVDAHPLLAAPVDGVVGQLLDGVQGLAPSADERAQLLPLQNGLVAALLVPVHLHLGLAAHVAEETGEKLHNLRRLLVLTDLPQVLGRQHRQGSGGLHGLLRPLLPLRTLPALRTPALLPFLRTGRLLRPLRRRGLDGLPRRRGCGGGGLRRLIRQTVAHPNLSRAGADAQKALLCPLQNLHGHLFPLQTQLRQGLCNSLVLGLARHIYKFRRHSAFYSFSS